MACEPCKICGIVPSGAVYLNDKGLYVYRECGHLLPGQRESGQTMRIRAVANGLHPEFRLQVGE